MNTRHTRVEDLRGRRFRALVRESTQDQAEKWGPERQRTDLRRAGEELGLVPVAPLFYERTGSGEASGSPEIETALSDARAGTYDVLLVLSTSRLARNVAEARRIKTEARKIGLVIYFVAERIVSGSFSSELHEGISEVLDEHANNERRFFIAGGLRERQKAGHWSGKVPTGYRRRMVERPDRTVGPDGGLEPDPIFAPIIRRIFADRLAGHSAHVIARRLNASGVRNTVGLPWRPRLIREIVSNPAYRGALLRYRWHRDYYYAIDDPFDGRQEITGDWPALVSEEDWVKAQVVTSRERGAGAPRTYPLSGILHCAACDRGLRGAMNSSGTRYYRCPGRADLGICSAPALRADWAEHTVVAEFLSDHRPLPGWEERREERLLTHAHRAQSQADKERLTAALARLREMYQWGDLPPAEYKARSAELRAELALAQPAAPIEVLYAYEMASDRWDEMEQDPAGRRALAKTLFQKIVVPEHGDPVFVLWPTLREVFDDLRVRSDVELNGSAHQYTIRFSA